MAFMSSFKVKGTRFIATGRVWANIIPLTTNITEGYVIMRTADSLTAAAVIDRLVSLISLLFISFGETQGILPPQKSARFLDGVSPPVANPASPIGIVCLVLIRFSYNS